MVFIWGGGGEEPLFIYDLYVTFTSFTLTILESGIIILASH